MKPQRNDPCPCGSGRKYKKCCGANVPATSSPSPQALNIPAMIQTAAQHYRNGRLHAAADVCRKVLQDQPKNLQALEMLSNVEADLGNLEVARKLLVRAINVDPRNADFHNNLGCVLDDLRQPDPAIACYNKALSLRPGDPRFLLNRGKALASQRSIDAAIADYARAWALDNRLVMAKTNQLYTLNFSDRYTAMEIAAEHATFGRTYQDRIIPFTSHPNIPDAGRRIRIGYVSADFRTHSVAYFIEPVLEHHDRAGFEVFLYYNNNTGDDMTRLFEQERCDHFRNIAPLSDEQAAATIRADAIDILVDLSGYSGMGRTLMFARKPAPLQASWIGYPNTTGLDRIDYWIGDTVVDPAPAADRLFAESLLRLPGCFCCYRPPAAAPDVADPPFLANGHITFGSFNNLSKVTDNVLLLWSRLLNAVPDSRLHLKGTYLSDARLRNRLVNLFKAEGIAQKRLRLLPEDPDQHVHLARYGDIDIALDCFPYNGTTTTCEAMWMGVPVIALTGNDHRSRVGTSLLTFSGHTELIADTADEYLDIAARLARDPNRLARYRRDLREALRRSPLMDAAGFTRQLETVCREIWADWCSKQQ